MKKDIFIYIASMAVLISFATSCENVEKLNNITNIVEKKSDLNSELLDNPIMKNINSDFFYICYSEDCFKNVLYGNNALEEINWYREKNEEKQFDANVILDFSDYGDIELMYKSEDSMFIVKNGVKQHIVNLIEKDDGLVSFDIVSENNKETNIVLYNREITRESLIKLFKTNDGIKNPFTNTNNPKYLVDPVTVGAAVAITVFVVGVIIDQSVEYCRVKRANAVERCHGLGKCCELSMCGGECYDCNNPPN